MMAEAVMCKPFLEELTDDDSTFSTGSPVLKKAKVCTDSHSSVEEETGSNKEMHEDEDQGDYEDESHDCDDDFRIYLNHIIDTKGFYVDMSLRPGCPFGVISPIYFEDDDDITPEWAKTAVGIAVDRYNADPRVSSKLEFIKIIRANHCKSLFYITFEAKSVSQGAVKTYQTKVFYRPISDDLDIDCEVMIFRREPKRFKKYVQDGDQPRGGGGGGDDDDDDEEEEEEEEEGDA